MTRDERRALWQHRLAEQQASGLSVAAWCAQQDLCPQTFAYWRKRLAEPTPTVPQWLALAPTADTGSGLALQVGAVTITVTPGFDPALLADVVCALTA